MYPGRDLGIPLGFLTPFQRSINLNEASYTQKSTVHKSPLQNSSHYARPWSSITCTYSKKILPFDVGTVIQCEASGRSGDSSSILCESRLLIRVAQTIHSDTLWIFPARKNILSHNSFDLAGNVRLYTDKLRGRRRYHTLWPSYRINILHVMLIVSRYAKKRLFDEHTS